MLEKIINNALERLENNAGMDAIKTAIKEACAELEFQYMDYYWNKLYDEVDSRLSEREKEAEETARKESIRKEAKERTESTETYKVRIVFTDGDVEVRNYRTLKDAERCIRIYSDCEECEHVHFVEEK